MCVFVCMCVCFGALTIWVCAGALLLLFFCRPMSSRPTHCIAIFFIGFALGLGGVVFVEPVTLCVMCHIPVRGACVHVFSAFAQDFSIFRVVSAVE